MKHPVRSLMSRWLWPDARRHAGSSRVVCHEWLAVRGGSDKVASELAHVAQATVLYTFAVNDDCVAALDLPCPVVTWRFGRWAGESRRFKALLPIMPIVWSALDLDRADAVVTSSHSCVNAVRTPNAHRVSYCHTPMRYAWEWQLEQERMPAWARPIMPVGAALLRWLDRRWSRRVDVFVANSSFVAERIRDAYGRSAEVVHPPVDVDRFRPRSDADGGSAVGTVGDEAPFVTAGRFVPYKRFDLAIEACNRTGARCLVVGDGPDLDRLKGLAGPTIEFVISPTDDEVVQLLQGARSFLFCGVEDFGMFPVEAQACGTPVIARRAGGALDSIVDGVTGTFVDSDDVDVWAAALRAVRRDTFDASTVRAHAERFGVERFRGEIRRLVRVDGYPR